MTDLEEDYHVRFTWQGGFDFADASSVEIILAPARSVWDDYFDENDYQNHTACYDLHKTENGVFAANIPLEIDTYHFLFRIDNCGGDLASSCGHHVTYLANGRKLNYVNVGNPNDILLKHHIDGQPTEKSETDDRSPLVDSTNQQSRTKKVRRRKRWFFCCYLD